jgi:Dickkopf N-terminal cysteine-rich region
MFQGTVAPMGMCKPSGLPSVGNYAAALASCTQPLTHACLFTGDGPNAPPQTATCAARTDAGATCFVDLNCKDGLYCANPQMKYSQGTCTPLKATGATCTLDAECASFTCRSAVCVVTTEATAYCVSK